MKTRLVLSLALWCAATLPLCAATTLFDFESEGEIGLWHDEGRAALGQDKRLERAERFAASGRFSLRFTTPAWRPEEHGGQSRWPAFEGKPPIADWSRYDRLAMEVVNATSAEQRFCLFIGDSVKPVRQGLALNERLGAFSRRQVVIPLGSGFASAKVNARDIRVMHFFTENPPGDLVVHVDRLLLLEPGENLPSLPAGYLRELAVLQAPAVESFRSVLDGAGQQPGAGSGWPAGSGALDFRGPVEIAGRPLPGDGRCRAGRSGGAGHPGGIVPAAGGVGFAPEPARVARGL